MIKQLHPTLKKCKCGFIASKRDLYKHFDLYKNLHTGNGQSFFAHHGEVPLNIDDPETEGLPSLSFTLSQNENK